MRNQNQLGLILFAFISIVNLSLSCPLNRSIFFNKSVHTFSPKFSSIPAITLYPGFELSIVSTIREYINGSSSKINVLIILFVSSVQSENTRIVALWHKDKENTIFQFFIFNFVQRFTPNLLHQYIPESYPSRTSNNTSSRCR